MTLPRKQNKGHAFLLAAAVAVGCVGFLNRECDCQRLRTGRDSTPAEGWIFCHPCSLTLSATTFFM